MSKFHFNDGEIEVPENWDDRSVLALSFPAGSKKRKRVWPSPAIRRRRIILTSPLTSTIRWSIS